MNPTELKPLTAWISKFADGVKIERRVQLTIAGNLGVWHAVTDHSQLFAAGAEFREAPKLLECWVNVQGSRMSYPYESEHVAMAGKDNAWRTAHMIEASPARLYAEELLQLVDDYDKPHRDWHDTWIKRRTELLAKINTNQK